MSGHVLYELSGQTNTENVALTVRNMEGNSSQTSMADLIEEAERAQRGIFIYPFVTVIFYMAIGLIGNSVVIYIFTMQWKLTKTTVFILTLAGVDLMSCVINMPTEAAILWNSMDFDYNVICKISRFTTFIASASSSFVLVAISIDRYLMVCRPFLGRELGVRYAKRTCLVAVLLGVFTTWPSLIIYGTYTYHVEMGHSGAKNNETTAFGKTCFISNYYVENYRLPAGFYFFLFGAHVIMFLMLTLVYSLIGRSLFMSTDPNVSSEKRHSLKYLGISLASAITGSVPNTPTENHCRNFGNRGSRPSSRSLSVENINRLDINQTVATPTVQNLEPNRLSGESNVSITVTQDDVNHNNDEFMRREEAVFTSVTHAPLATIESCDLSDQLKKATNPTDVVPKTDTESDVERRPKPVDKNSYQLTLGKQDVSNLPNGRLSSESTASDRSLIPTTPMSPDSVRGILFRSQSVESRARLNRIIYDELRQTDLNRSSLRRNTLMLRMVTIAFIISFLPYLIIVTVRYSNPDIPTKLNKIEQIFYHVFLRTYFINSMINPFIYGFMNEEFRLKIKDLFCKFCTRHQIRLGV